MKDIKIEAAETVSLFCRLNQRVKKELPIRSSEMGLSLIHIFTVLLIRIRRHNGQDMQQVRILPVGRIFPKINSDLMV